MSDSEMQQQVQRYNELVLRYEALDHEIDRLIMRYGGRQDRMPQAEQDHYRQLARTRDELQNDIRNLEQELFSSDSDK